VQPTRDEDAAAVEHAAMNPEQFEAHKIWKGSSWEILRPGKIDIIGFGGSWVLVGVVLGLLWVLATIGS
jgi:SSS family solute:Na+ symporter